LKLADSTNNRYRSTYHPTDRQAGRYPVNAAVSAIALSRSSQTSPLGLTVIDEAPPQLALCRGCLPAFME
jgi:hypothetical protein